MTFDDFGKTLSNADVEAFREMWTWFKNQRRNQPHGRLPESVSQSPDVYLVRCSEDIPAMTIEAGTGTDSSVGLISKRDCKLFRIDDRDPSIDVDPIGMERPVYNPSTTAVPADTLFLAVKTKDGKFVAALGGGSGDRVSVVELVSSGVIPPAGYLDARRRRWSVTENRLLVLNRIWLKDVTSSPSP